MFSLIILEIQSQNPNISYKDLSRISEDLDSIQDNIKEKLKELEHLKKKFHFFQEMDPTHINKVFYNNHINEIKKGTPQEPYLLQSHPKYPINPSTFLSQISIPHSFFGWVKSDPCFEYSFPEESIIYSFLISKTNSQSCLVKEFIIILEDNTVIGPFSIQQRFSSCLYQLPTPALTKKILIKPISNYGDPNYYGITQIDFMGITL